MEYPTAHGAELAAARRAEFVPARRAELVPVRCAEFAPARRAEFDWLRVLALGMLMIFHSAVGYSSWPWRVNDPHTSALFDNFLDFLLRWRVSLVFIVSGSALMLALQRRRHVPPCASAVLDCWCC